MDLDQMDFSRSGLKGDEMIVNNLNNHNARNRVGTAFLGYKAPFAMRMPRRQIPEFLPEPMVFPRCIIRLKMVSNWRSAQKGCWQQNGITWSWS